MFAAMSPKKNSKWHYAELRFVINNYLDIKLVKQIDYNDLIYENK